ncbi:expansin EXLX1 family cellulose-binding protein [Kitasatospora sp. A2-31]|uniref:expansin EXLX1 family cellulose-binding protein n=1 Tax=Kitasatospora sp. A2-31 TaxID=2916414 RepID=UPI001EE9BFDE|nr:expansin EXLX1 family cellulose-binding protein [Kitasatospora sp. A2-31]MCG6494357.1 hypothetical protein [Kitasatospora sp. A2-31]
MGIALALVAVGVPVCLAFGLLPGGGGDAGSARPATAASVAAVAATGPGAPPGTDVPADPTLPAASPSVTGPPSPSATGTPSTSATSVPRPSAPTAGTAIPSPSADSATSVPARASAAPAPTRGQGTAPTTPPPAGRIKPGTDYQGVATSYDAADGNGACSFGPAGDLMVAAMNHTDYESSRACGASVLVRAANGASITVRIVNECPLPCAPGQLDLSHEAFARLADLSVGRLPISWTVLSPATAPDTMSIRYKTGSSQWWCGIQVIGHRNPVAALEVRTTAGWRQLTRTDYNYFLSPDGSGCGAPLRVTDVYGEQLTVDGIAVKPDVAQPTRVQFARH